MIIEQADKDAEQAIVASIGSTGKGGGAAAARRITGRNKGVDPSVRLARDVPELAAFIGSTADALEKAYAAGHRILLEGTQGDRAEHLPRRLPLPDQPRHDHGWHPGRGRHRAAPGEPGRHGGPYIPNPRGQPTRRHLRADGPGN